MTLTALKGYVLWPEPQAIATLSTMAITATTHRAAAVIAAPKTGTIDRVGILVAAVTATAALRVRVESLDATGNPSGTLLGTDSEGTIPTPGGGGTWHEVTLTAPIAVTKGQVFAIVIDAPSGTPNLTIGRMTMDILPTFPYTDLFTASWVKAGQAPSVAVRYNDGSYPYIQGVVPVTSVVNTAFNNTTNPDERGVLFTVPVDMEIEGAWIGQSTNAGDFQVVIYNADDSVRYASPTIDGDWSTLAANSIREVPFDAVVTLDAGTQYRLVLKPTTATSTSIRSMAWDASVTTAMFAAGDFQRTTRNDGGAWTNTATSRENIGLIVSKVHAEGSSGRYKTKVGGTLVDLL